MSNYSEEFLQAVQKGVDVMDKRQLHIKDGKSARADQFNNRINELIKKYFEEQDSQYNLHKILTDHAASGHLEKYINFDINDFNKSW